MTCFGLKNMMEVNRDKTIFGKYYSLNVFKIPIWIIVHFTFVLFVSLSNLIFGTFFHSTDGFVGYLEDGVNYALVGSGVLIVPLVRSVLNNFFQVHNSWSKLTSGMNERDKSFYMPMERAVQGFSKWNKSAKISYYLCLGLMAVLLLNNQVIVPWNEDYEGLKSWSMAPRENFGSYIVAVIWGGYIYVFMVGSILWYFLYLTIAIIFMMINILIKENFHLDKISIYPLPIRFQPAFYGLSRIIIKFCQFSFVVGINIGVYIFVYEIGVERKIPEVLSIIFSFNFHEKVIIVLIVFAIVVSVCVIFPIFLMHQCMKKIRDAKAQWFVRETISSYDNLSRMIIEGFREEKIDKSKYFSELENLDELESVVRKIDSATVWPLDLSMMIKVVSIMLSAIFSPILAILLENMRFIIEQYLQTVFMY